ncbi:MAG: hypothetical protein AAF790_14305 [Planctomycetota bacterium]
MKNLTFLLSALVLMSSVTGCGCCRRIGDFFNRGAYCGPSALASPGFLAQPTTPVVVPQPAFPQASIAPACCPCEPCCDPCGPIAQPCCETYGYGSTPDIYPTYGSGCDSCGGVSGTFGTTPTMGAPMTVSPSMSVDPGPAPGA